VIASLRRAFPDFHFTMDDVAVRDDLVWLRMTGTGTNDGRYMGHEPTGRPMRTAVIDVLRVDGTRIVEYWGVPDRLGALPARARHTAEPRRGARLSLRLSESPLARGCGRATPPRRP
jgi:hypothetical protein